MSYDFPTGPATGTVVTVPDGSYRVWDSQKWRASPSGASIYPPGSQFLPLAGGTVTGLTTFQGGVTVTNTGPLFAAFSNLGRGLTQTFSGSTIPTGQLAAWVNGNVTGTSSVVADLPVLAYFATASANINAPNALVDTVGIVQVTGGANAVAGAWNALSVNSNDGVLPTNDLAGGTGGAFQAMQVARRATQNQGGAGLTPLTSFGQNWGIDVVATATGTNLALLNGIEINNSIQTAGSVVRRAGLQVSSPAAHVKRAAMWDNGILIATAGAPFINGVSLGGVLSAHSPLDTDSKVFAYELAQDLTGVANVGLEMNDIMFTTASIKVPGFMVDPIGTTRVGTTYLTPSSTGLAIDTKGSTTTGTPTISAGGSGYPTAGGVGTANVQVDDAYGGVYTLISSSTGVITGVSGVVRRPIYNGLTPPATLAVTGRAPSLGTGCVLGVTWNTTATTLALQPSGGATVFGGPVSVPGQISVPAGGSIQAAHDALPATGGSILLAANTVYTVLGQTNITKPNVHISAPSWGTIVRRDPSFNTGIVIYVSGAGCTLEGFTVDGNGVACPSYFDVNIQGNNALVSRMQLLNNRGSGQLALAGNNSRATGNTITGMGIDTGIPDAGYGIWALGAQTVTIDNNTISGMNCDGIGVDGNGSRVIGNRVFSCHWSQFDAGGQIAIYPLNGDQSGGNGVTVVGNTVGTGGGSKAHGIEVDGPNALIAGNYIDTVQSYGIVITHSGAMVTGNTIRNSPATSSDAIAPTQNATNFVITGNKIFDDRATPLMRTGVWVSNTAADNYVIVGNSIIGATLASIVDHGQGMNKTIASNQGYDNAIPSVVSAATVQLPMNPVIYLTGSASITAIDLTIGNAIGRSIVIIPTATASFVGGAGGIANGIACTPNNPIRAVFDGTSWYFTAIGLPLTGGGLSGGLNFGAANASSNTDVSRHISLNTTAPTGFNVTAGQLNYTVPASTRHSFNVAGTVAGSFGIDGFDATAIGALAPCPGTFTTLRVNGNVGFYNTAPVAKPTVSGAKGSNAALGSLIAALVSQGLIADTTTA